METIDFLSMLHTPEPGFHPTYDIVHTTFFFVDFVICTALTLGLLQLFLSKDKKPSTAIIVLLAVTVIRTSLIYYLYWYSEPKVHFVPYIYKNANEFSGLFRGLFLPLQIFIGFITAGLWIRASKKAAVIA